MDSQTTYIPKANQQEKDKYKKRLLLISDKFCAGKIELGLGQAYYMFHQTIQKIKQINYQPFYIDSRDANPQKTNLFYRLKTVIDEFKPDLVVISSIFIWIPPNKLFCVPSRDVIKTLCQGITSVFISTDTANASANLVWTSQTENFVDVIEYWDGYVDIIAHIDCHFHAKTKYPQEKYSSKHIYAFSPFDPNLFERNERLPKDIDYAFSGTQHGHRIDFINAIKSLPYKAFVGGGPQIKQPLPYWQYIEYLQRSKIAVNFSGNNANKLHQIKGRIWESIYCDCLLFEQDNTETRRILEAYDCAVFFSTPEELASLLDKFIKNPELIRAKKHNGKKFLKDYDYKKFWDLILQAADSCSKADVLEKRHLEFSDVAEPSIADMFTAGNYTDVVLKGDTKLWQTYAAMGLIGKVEEAIDGLSGFDCQEARFYSAVASWIGGDDETATKALKKIPTPHAQNLLAKIIQPQIQVLAQIPWNRYMGWDLLRAITKDKKFEVQNISFHPDDLKNQPYANIHQFYDSQNPPDFYITLMVEWHLIPPNIRELPCPLFGHTADYDLHIQAVYPWLQLFDELIVEDSSEWHEVSRLAWVPVSTFPKCFGIPETLISIPKEPREIDIFQSGTLLHPYHFDKVPLVHQMLRMEGIHTYIVNNFLHPDAYEKLLGQSKTCYTYVRHPGAMPTRALDALRMGCAVVVQKGSALTLYLGEEEGVMTYEAKANNLVDAIQNIVDNWSEFEKRAGKGAAILRQEFELSRVASQYLRFLTFLAAKPRNPRQIRSVGLLTQKRSVLFKGWIPEDGKKPGITLKKIQESTEGKLQTYLQKGNVSTTILIDLVREMVLYHCYASCYKYYPEPVLIQENCGFKNSYNLIAWQNNYYAIPQEFGAFDVSYYDALGCNYYPEVTLVEEAWSPTKSYNLVAWRGNYYGLPKNLVAFDLTSTSDNEAMKLQVVLIDCSQEQLKKRMGIQTEDSHKFEWLTDALSFYCKAIAGFPECLVLRFNLIRVALHFGKAQDVSFGLQIAKEALEIPKSYWEIDVMEDVFPWDFCNSFFNYRRYFDLVTEHLALGAPVQEELVQLILASLNCYLGHYAKTPDHFQQAIALDPEFPFYKLEYAKKLMERGEAGDYIEAGALLTELADSSLVFAEALSLLKYLQEKGLYVSHLWKELEGLFNTVNSKNLFGQPGENLPLSPLRVSLNLTAPTEKPSNDKKIEAKKLLSVVVTGRNDDYMGNFKYRLTTCLDYLCRNLSQLGRLNDVEVLITDWNSDVPLANVLALSPEASRICKFVCVPPEIAARLQPPGEVFYPTCAMNASLRRAKGEFVMMFDADSLMPYHSLRALLDVLEGKQPVGLKLDQTFYYCSRHHLPLEVVQRELSLEELDRYLLVNGAGLPKDKGWPGLGVCGAAQMMHRSLWQECRGYNQDFQIQGWLDAELTLRVTQHYAWVDLLSLGVVLFHMEHWANNRQGKENLQKHNPHDVSSCLVVNDENWGLGNYELEIQTSTLRVASL